jgi:hypothetical protein
MISDEHKLITFDKTGRVVTILSVLQKGITLNDIIHDSDVEGLTFCISELVAVRNLLKKSVKGYRRNLTND